jgi:membrane protein implicated in regulation of membrane protease activity
MIQTFFKKNKNSIIWMIFGIFSLLRYLQTGDQFLLWTGLIIGIGHLFIILRSLFKTLK